MKQPACTTRHVASRGFSLVELMVAIVIGLIVVAAALSFFSHHWRESRAVQIELRLMQDLRSAADLIGRDLRRAAYWGNSAAGVWQRDANTVALNPYAELTYAAPSATSSAVAFSYSRDAAENHTIDSNEQFGFRLRAGVVEFLLGLGNWQALTDANTVTITSFTVTPSVQSVSLDGRCAVACSAADLASATCPPQQHLRSLSVQMKGHAAADSKVQRQVENRVRLRNDAISGRCST